MSTVIRVTRSMLAIVADYQSSSYRDVDGVLKPMRFDAIVLTLNDGREFYLSNAIVKITVNGPRPLQVYNPEVILNKIITKGYVDLRRWIENEYATLTMQEVYGDRYDAMTMRMH